jgi:hypothetical protein
MDDEFNLVSQSQEELRRLLLLANTPSGFVTTSHAPKLDYSFDRQATNMFWLGNHPSDIAYALVNGWIIPITGTLWSEDARAAIKLPPPSAPPQEADVNFVFLEVWQSLIAPTGVANKPAVDSLWPFGNVEFGGTILPHELIHPKIGLETSKRVQIQYRIRVIPRVNPALSPYGFNPSIRPQGPLPSPTTAATPLYQYQNMRDEMGDAGLWRAGDGNGQTGLLQTVDGYVYAVPIALVFRRNSGTWGLTQGMHDLAFNRNPSMVNRLDARVLPHVTLMAPLTPDALVATVNLARQDTPFPAMGSIKIGEEVITYSDWTGTTLTFSERGARGTHPSAHQEDALVQAPTSNPLGLYADQIIEEDVYDLRPAVQLRGHDHHGLLEATLDRLLNGQLTSAWKRSEANMKGTRHFQVDVLTQGAVPPNGTLEGDAPDGFRRVFSDAVVPQSKNLIVFGESDATAAIDWSLNPIGTVQRTVANQWNTGDILRIPLDQYRNTFKTGANQKVRFVHPLEYFQGSDHDPVKVWFGSTDEASSSPTEDDYLSYSPLGALVNFGRPFTVLGEKPVGLPVPVEGSGPIQFISTNVAVITGVDFSLLFQGQTVANFLASTEACLIAGDNNPNPLNPINHGAWRIVGSDGGTGLLLERLDASSPAFDPVTNVRDWAIRYESCTEADTEVYIVLTGQPLAPFSLSPTLSISYTLLYHASRGLARCPENGLFVRVDTPNPGVTNYVRELNFPDEQSATAATVRDFPCYPLAQIAQFTLEDLNLSPRITPTLNVAVAPKVWGEAYTDRASKTLVFQPVRRVQARLLPRALPNTLPAIAIPNFLTTAGSPSYAIPYDILPPKGMQQVPFVSTRSNGSLDVPFGVNFLFLLSGGQNPAAQNPNPRLMLQRVLLSYNPASGVPFGNYVPLSTYGGNALTTEALSIRRYNQNGVQGFELPSHLGIARLFGIYRAPDFYTNGGLGAFAAPVFRNDAGSTIENLIRTDRGVLHITDQGTFVIPDEMLDASRLDAATPVPIIFEVALFAFDTWPNRRDGFMRVLTTNAAGEPPGVTLSLLLNGPATQVDTIFMVSTRRPYQGSFTGTMPVSTTNSSNLDPVDYIPKRATETPPQIMALRESLDPLTAKQLNPASLQILAYKVFVTTQGTGRVSGPFVPGSYTDVGHMGLAGYPFSTITDPTLRVRSRALSFPNTGTPDGYAHTERLPLGILAQDAYFLGEGLGPKDSSFWLETYISGPSRSALQARNNRILTTQPCGSGIIVVSDGTSLGSSTQIGYNASFGLYRTYRGGTLTDREGQPCAWQGPVVYKDLTILPTPLRVQDRQIHGGALFCVAFLVRTTREVATDLDIVTNYGDELQVVVVTGLQLGRDLDVSTLGLNREPMELLADLHVTGIGEGYCAVDRYRCEGRPMERGAVDLKTRDVARTSDGGNTPQVPDPCLCAP